MTPAASFQEFESLTRCPVCDGREIAPAFAPDVARCGQCHTYFRNPRPTQDEIRRSYDYGANYENWSQMNPEGRKGMWQRRLDLLHAAKASGNLLDVGMGDGYFLDLAKAAGFSTSGTELSETGTALARKRGHEIRMGQVTAIDFQGESFDVITMWHVLEHLPDPGAAVRKVHSLLRPGGIFALAVPDEENHLFRHRLGLLRTPNPLGAVEWGAEIHLTHFQPATLRSALRAANFEVLRFGVDDIYLDRTWKNLAKLAMQKTLSSLFAWHFSMAMFCVCRKAL